MQRWVAIAGPKNGRPCATLFRYKLGAIAPIRIVVKNGDVILEGVVATEADKNVAGIAASGVPGVFSVTNDLHVGA